MNDLQENKLSSYEAVDFVLNTDAHKAIWQTDTDFAALVTQLGTLITDIHNLHAVQVLDNTGTTLLKADIRRQLIDAMLIVIRAVDTHAIYTNDPQLQASVSYTLSDLFKARDNVLADTALAIYNIAYPIRADLAARQLTEADITRVSELNQQYTALIPETRITVTQSKSATKDLRDKIAQVDDLLTNKIDHTIMIYKRNHPAFIEQYFTDREIINLGHRYTNQKVGRITGTVLQAGTLIPLHNALIEIIGVKRSTKTDDKGFFTLIFRKKAFVTLRVTLEGYKTYTGDPITIKPGDQLNLKIEVE
jgi:hypothetical protein